jgi:hypothetical protein
MYYNIWVIRNYYEAILSKRVIEIIFGGNYVVGLC